MLPSNMGAKLRGRNALHATLFTMVATDSCEIICISFRYYEYFIEKKDKKLK